MGLSDFLFGSAASGAGALLEGAGSFAKDIRAAITGDIDPEKKADLEMKAVELEASISRAQAAINEAEAKSASIFVAGWRPFIGWICGISLGAQCIVFPLVAWASALMGHSIAVPDIGSATLETTLWGMLGLGTLRTYEKYTNAAQRH